MPEAYVPRVLLCGDESSFQIPSDMPIEVIGKISFTGSPERGENFLFPTDAELDTYKPGEIKIFLNGAEISIDDLQKILSGTVDYIVCTAGEFIGRYNDFYALGFANRAIQQETLVRQARRNFYSYSNFRTLEKIVCAKNFARVLDVDAYFAQTDFAMFNGSFPHVDVVGQNIAPIYENFYTKIYETLADCRFKVYDALLLAERSPVDFIDAVTETDDLSDVIVTFARKNTALEKFFFTHAENFAKIFVVPAAGGNWYIIDKHMSKSFCVYVVTHKDPKLSALPEGYKIIQAGHAVSGEDFGYLTDDTGDNISELNLYVNEVTALYWIWKNTRHTIVGLNHYRRFFTESTDKKFAVEKILSQSAAEKILRDYDIIVAENFLLSMPVNSWHKMLSDFELEPFVDEIFRRHIADKQPDYLDSFDHVSNAYTGFQYEIFITRYKIFDEYCKWLFSFLLDVTAEVFARTNIRKIDNPRKYRIISFIVERLLTVWLRKNRLRIKKLPILFRDGV